MIYCIADTHFFDAASIQAGRRHFPDLSIMHSYLIENWNKTVSKSDQTVICGDFCCGNVWGVDSGPRTIQEVANSLNGRKILVRGNHDTDIRCSLLMECDGWEIYDWYISDKCLFTHEYSKANNFFGICVSAENVDYTPIQIPLSRTWVNVCGHSHNRWFLREPRVKK